MEPYARDWTDIRHHLEHKYLKIHLDLWTEPDASSWLERVLRTLFAKSLNRCDFDAKTLKLLQVAAGGIMYLAFAITHEERLRAKKRPKGQFVSPSVLPPWEDKWKK